MKFLWKDAIRKLRAMFGKRMVLTGAVAMAFYGYERQTGDLDIIVLAGKDDPSRLVQDGCELKAKMNISGGEVWKFGLHGKEVDVQVLQEEVYKRIRKRSVLKIYDGLHTVRIIHIRDLIEMKWQRRRLLDLSDVAHLERTMIGMGLEPPFYALGEGVVKGRKSLKKLNWEPLFD